MIPLLLACEWGSIRSVRAITWYWQNGISGISWRINTDVNAENNSYDNIVQAIGACDRNGLNSLHLAAKGGYLEIVEELLLALSKVHERQEYEQQSVPKKSLRSFRNARDVINAQVVPGNGWTPLHYAAHHGHLSVIACLVEQGKALVNVSAGRVGTPLNCAVRKGHSKIVHYLVQHGADVNIKISVPLCSSNGRGMTSQKPRQQQITANSSPPSPLDIACQTGDRKIVQYLLDHGAEVLHDTIHYASNNIRIARALIKANNASIYTRKNGKSIFDYDWINPLLKEDHDFHRIVSNTECFRSWNFLSFLCWIGYGKKHGIELFQLIENKQNVKMPLLLNDGSKYFSRKYLALDSDSKDEHANVNANVNANTNPIHTDLAGPANTTNSIAGTGDGNATTPTAAQSNSNSVQTTVESITSVETRPIVSNSSEAVRILMTESDVRKLRSILEEMGVTSREEVQQPTATTIEDDEKLLIDAYFAKLQAGTVPDFRSTSCDDYRWMVHAAASIHTCPVRIVRLLASNCFPGQLRVQRHNGRTPLLLACQRPCYHYNYQNDYIENSKRKQQQQCQQQFNRSDDTIDGDDVVSYLLNSYPLAAKVCDDDDMLPIAYALQTKKVKCIQSLVDAYPEGLPLSLQQGAVVGCIQIDYEYLFHLASTVTVNTMYQLLRYNPASILQAPMKITPCRM